jgi:hypothetical protein
VTFLMSLCKMLVSTWDETITCVFFKHIQLLSLMNWNCAYQIWHHTLVDVVIVDPMQVNLYLRSCATQAKEKSYHNQHPTNQFLPFSNWGICLLTQTCQCVFTRLCQCHLKRLKGLHLSTLLIFLCQKVLMTL